MVMYKGSVVELADTSTLFNNASHPYTKQLISAVPIADPKIEAQRIRIKMPEDLSANSQSQKTELTEVAPDHWVAQF